MIAHPADGRIRLVGNLHVKVCVEDVHTLGRGRGIPVKPSFRTWTKEKCVRTFDPQSMC